MRGKLYILVFFYLIGYLPTMIGLVMFVLCIYLFFSYLKHQQLLLALSIFLYIISTLHSPKIDDLFMTQSEQHYEGEVRVVSDINVTDYYTQYTLELENEYRVQVRLNDSSHLLKYGSICNFQGQITPPQPATNPGQFDYSEFLKKQGVIGLSYDPKISDCHSASIWSHLFSVRHFLVEQLESQYTDQTNAWLKALIFGDRSYISSEVLDAFQFWNISHLLAISGLHVGFFIAFLYVILHYVFKLPNEYIKWLIIAILPFYIVIAGANPPVLRAGFMALIILLASMFHKKLDTTDVISIVLILILWFDPYLVYQLAFQFSFIVTLSLVLSKNFLKQDHWLLISLKVSLISQLAILPIQFNHFYFTNVLSFLANLIFVPYYTFFAIPVSLLLVVAVVLPRNVANLIETLYLNVQEAVHAMVVRFGEPQLAIWVVGEVSLITVIAFYLLLLLMMRAWSLNQLKKAALFGSLAISVFFIEQYAPFFDSTYKITMLDVGQAEAIVVELPNRRGVFIVDVGEEVIYPFDGDHDRNYTSIIKPYLWSNGIRQIDALFISHFDFDHVASAQLLIDEFSPTYIFSHPFIEEQDYLDDESMEQLIPIYEGVNLELAGAKLFVLAPEKSNEFLSKSENERSNVLILQYDGHQTLFTGDTYESVELDVARKYNLSEVDLLKVAHHGSDTSSNEKFLNAVGAEVAIISAGRNNRYNHPTPLVYERLLSEGYEVYRTDKHGAITIEIDGGQGTIKPFMP
ncbi:DNA internalization-related competence protein ComEC/Rec2 [Alkalibacillus haloalkaliphilus]|uniref:DNA internalization-related competence protein ComEC/Rec2 n=1 Tax=Alkalibacillus haloalkaliphilus TaxID=94136 RepID=UPI0011BF9071|nr:DNA internalization-related competence protein ComEC/Rec2 [Alkalibacillus haloalkaliphilus]